MTIEERAVSYAIEEDDGWCVKDSIKEQAYIKGATDQREIDIEVACELAKTYLLVTTPQEVADERLKRFREALKESKRFNN